MINISKSLLQKPIVYEIDGYVINVSTVVSIEHLKQDWSRLEAQHRVPFFLSWHWISCWEKTYLPNITAVTASFKNQVVAIGLFTQSINTRKIIIRSKQLRLHQVGDLLKDQIWMEYNDFICDPDHKDSAVNACLQTMLKPEFIWDEIVISMMPYSRAEAITSALPLAKIDFRIPVYAVNLSDIREKKVSYIATLKPNTRYQIRRSLRLYSSGYGELKLYKAADKTEALSLFREVGKYHLKRWPDSGFKNPQFVQFHENIIRDSFDNGSIQLLRINAGEETIAIMYYHITGSQVFFYLHGLNYHSDTKLKPGLVAHVLATDYFLHQGMNTYDYMGGYSQYKMQLANQTEDLATVIIQRPRSQFRLESMARNLKRRILHISSSN